AKGVYRSCLFLFFFQAVDGIRYFHVTGVQTCALPIFGPVEMIDAQKGYRLRLGGSDEKPFLSPWYPHPETGKTSVPLKKGQIVRSEERRVGKSVDRGGRRSSG